MESNQNETSTSSNQLLNKVSPTLIELSADLCSIYKKQINPDLTLNVSKKSFKCHCAILSARSKWFGFKINQLKSAGATSIILKENENVIEALMLYIYTGNLLLLEPLKVPLLDLRAAASQYSLDKLQKLLTRVIKTEDKLGPVETRDFLWKLNINDCKSVGALCSLEGFTLNGTDRWCLKMSPLCSNHVKYAFWIYVVRETISKNNIIHLASLELNILDMDGNTIRTFFSDHIFKKDGESKVSEHISLCKLLENPAGLLPDGILTLSGFITVYGEHPAGQRMIFQIRSPHEKGVTNEFHNLSFDMYNMMKASNFTDIGIAVKGTPGFVLHSNIVYARSLIPIKQLGYLMEAGNFGPIVWRSFIHFMYTGQARYLEDHVLEIYRMANKYRFVNARKKYSSVLSNYLTASNVYDVVTEAAMYEDTELVRSGLVFIAENDIIDYPAWFRFASNHPRWTREIMKQTRRKKVLNL